MAMRASIKMALITSAAVGAIGFSVIKAQAGGFYVHEQSAYFQGTSWAGVAAGGPSLSAMFWNPATITQHGLGLTTEVNATTAFPRTDITPIAATSPTGVDLTPFGRSGNLHDEAGFIPASYYVYGLNNWISFGLGLNSPFGLRTQPNPLWAGMFYSRESEVKSINATPTVALKINDWLSVGVGAQIEYFKVKLYSAFPGSGATGPFPFLAPVAPDQLRIDGDSIDFGFTAGITITPTPWTTIGVGYRSRIDHGIEGDIFRPAFVAPVRIGAALIPVGFPSAFVNFSATVPLPDIASASIRQKITESFTLLGTVEWTNWSRLGRVPVATNPIGPIPGIPTELAFEWRDGWLVSGGVEYQWTGQIAVRAGIGWEQSPITDRTRGTRLPDADRLWVSAGGTYKWNEQLWIDFGYSHVFVDDAAINLTAASGNPTFNPGLGTFVGTANGQVDILSIALRYRFLPPAAPVVGKG